MKPIAWFKHGPYEEGEKLECAFADPKDDVNFSPLHYVPEGWSIVPSVGSYVKADHPLTVLNPTKVFEVVEVKSESGRFYARGKHTMWFGVGMLTEASLDETLEHIDDD